MTKFHVQNNAIHVILKTTSNWNVAYPDGADENNTTLTVKKRINGNNVPYFPANGLRGRFRRYIAKRAIDAMVSTQGQLSLETHIALQSGSSHTQPDKANSSIEELVRASEHIYMGVFGGGSRMLESRYAVSDIHPILNSTVENGVVQAPFALVQEIIEKQNFGIDGDVKQLQPYQIVERRSFIKVDDISRGNNIVDVTQNVEGGESAIADYLEGVSKNQQERKTQKSKGEDVAKKLTLGNILGVESICAGVDMHFRIDVSPDLTEAQVGALLVALEDLANVNYLGGWGRTGFGRFKISAIHADLPALDISETIVDELYQGEHFSFDYTSLSSLTAEAHEAIQAIDKEEMIDYFTPREVAIKRGKDKLKG
jgi:CRISPR type IV-associated protein Csf2